LALSLARRFLRIKKLIQKANLDAFIADLASGNLNLFKGPLNYQSGKEYLKEGETATDNQIWYMPELLEGIEGESK
jgi:simple sugar transport system substrate-binding protein